MEWQPDQESLVRVVGVLRNSSSPRTDIQEAVRSEIKDLNAYPEFSKYLCVVLTRLPDESQESRSVAGLLIKNNIRVGELTPDVLEYIRATVLDALGDQSRLVRATVGSIVTAYCKRYGLDSWPEIVPSLLGLAETADHIDIVNGCFSALYRICEDTVEELEQPQNAELLGLLLSKCIPFMRHESESVAEMALECCFHLVFCRNNIITLYLESMIESLFELASCDSIEVRKQVCRTIVALFEVQLEPTIQLLSPHMDDVVTYMLQMASGENDHLAVEACEFFLAVTEQEGARDFLRPHLPDILTMLLERMCYSEDDLLALHDANEADAHIPDAESDIRPVHAAQHASKGWGRNSIDEEGDGNETEEGEESDEEFARDDGMASWNIRKEAAAVLDVIANTFRDDILPILLPLLQELLQDDSWVRKEAGILALGAIAPGCMAGLQEHLADVTPFLLISLQDQIPLVRSIACWTLSRFSGWVVSLGPDHENFQQLVERLLACVLDNSKRVQRAACAALATLEDIGKHTLVPFLPYILSTFVDAFDHYQHKNMLFLYDAVGTLADNVNEHLNRPEYIEIIMPPLIRNWHLLEDDHRDLFMHLECLNSLVLAIGPGFVEHAEPVFARSILIIQKNLKLVAEAGVAADVRDIKQEKEFIIVAIDLLTSLGEAIGPAIESLVGESAVFELLYICLQDDYPDLRQSSLALLGELTRSCFVHMEEHIESFMPLLFENIYLAPSYPSVCNNAVWSIGEISMFYGDRMAVHVSSVMTYMIKLIVFDKAEHPDGSVASKKTPNVLRENTAIALGRLGLVCTELVAPQLKQFARHWCCLLNNINDDNMEKEQAYRGFCAMIKRNPLAMLPEAFAFFCNAVNQYKHPSAELAEDFRQIFMWYKGSMGGERWDMLMARFPGDIAPVLQERFNLLD